MHRQGNAPAVSSVLAAVGSIEGAHRTLGLGACLHVHLCELKVERAQEDFVTKFLSFVNNVVDMIVRQPSHM